MNRRVQDKIREFLYSHNRKTVDLASLQGLFSGGLDYALFAAAVQQLEEEGVLLPVNAQGWNNKTPAVANRYRLGQAAINHEFFELLNRMRLRFHPLIQLDHYYKAGSKRWEQDRPWLEKLDIYLKTGDLPTDWVPTPERSYQVFGNEKWLDEEGGRELLERAGISEEMLGISPAPEPLMWAVQPALQQITERGHHHLILENKTPFQVLLPVLPEQTSFTTLIYGRGKTIVNSLSLFFDQTGIPSRPEHTFHYFGDLDREGISIWYSLRNKVADTAGIGEIRLALSFYRALLAKSPTIGRDNQRAYPEAVTCFINCFPELEQRKIAALLNNGYYLPQEALTSAETREIWRNY
ncbi:MAG: DUF2220 family protein [Clostridia bacterium]|nr:DUF2220 family protein [Clostridia bacterium]